MVKKNFQSALFVLVISVLPTVLVWLPFFSRFESFWGIPVAEGGMQTVIANYDGPLYIVVAKSLYNLDLIASNFSLPLPLEYYAAHFPLYPLVIRSFAFATGYPWGSMLATLIGVILANIFFYKLARKHFKENESMWLTLLFAFFPARWLIVKSVGSPEPLFIGTILASVYYFQEKKYFKAGVWGALAQLTKSPGILLFLAYAGWIATDKLRALASSNQSIRKWVKGLDFRAYPVILIPAALIFLFWVYGRPDTFDNFLAYFNSGDNIHLFFPPFQIFNYSQPWVNTHWLEEVIFVYLFGMLGFIKLVNNKRYLFAWFVGIFFITIIFVSHRDILRYSLPITPFLILAFGQELQNKNVKLAFLFLILPVYLFSLAFISNNAMPISDWAPFL